MDDSRVSSRSVWSNGSANGLRRCMTIRLARDETVADRNARSRKAYNIRKESRLEDAGLESLRVSFDKVQIREYPIILGSNPAVSQGPPLEIDWKYVDEEEWDFEDYEKTRPVSRTYGEMNIPMSIRIQILERAGISNKSIMQRSKEVKAIRIRRLETQQQMYRKHSHERTEKWGRGLKNFFFADRKRKEKDLMEQTKHLGQLPLEENPTVENFMTN